MTKQLLNSPTDGNGTVTNAPNTYRFTGSLSGPDEILPGSSSLAGSAMGAASSGSIGIGISGSGGIGHELGFPCIADSDPDYAFHGSISEDMLHRYLDRSLEMEDGSMWGNWVGYPNYDFDGFYGYFQGIGPNYPINDGYTSTWYGNSLNTDAENQAALSATSNVTIHGTIQYQHGQDRQMLMDIRPKMIHLMVGLWGALSDNANKTSWDLLDGVCQILQYDIEWIHCNVDPDTICHAAVYETIGNAIGDGSGVVPGFSGLAFPSDPAFLAVFEDEYITTYHAPIYDRIGGNFNFENMLYPEWTSYTKFYFVQLITGAWPLNGVTMEDVTLPDGTPGKKMSGLSPLDGVFPLGLTGNGYWLVSLDGSIAGASPLNTPDMSQLETRMYYYYIATKYIDCGCESFTIGANSNAIADMCLYITADNPTGANYLGQFNGGQYRYDLYTKIRAYAAANARRGLALISSGGGYAGIFDYYDPVPTAPLANFERQLLGDYHGAQMPYTRVPGCMEPSATFPDTPVYYPAVINAQWVSPPPAASSLYDNAHAGIHPQGWYCVQAPLLANYDNSGVTPPAGCAFWNYPSDWYQDFGYDEATWFAMQTEDNRNAILKYGYYRIKCLNQYAHCSLPGRKLIDPQGGADYAQSQSQYYRANTGIYEPDFTGSFNQQSTIKNIFNGVYAGPDDWVHHNFTLENVSDSERGINVSSSAVFVGDNAVYYIGTDGNIYGYVKVSDNAFGGVWLTVCPSCVADVPDQVKAKSDLVASPGGATAGTTLLYIGVDGRVHGFTIIDIWTYAYFNFIYDPGVSAVCCLIYPTASQIYYIGNTTDGQHVHGFQNTLGHWQTVSPSYSAVSVYGQSIGGQEQAASGLAYDAFANRIYYAGQNGLLYYYNVNTLIDYYYNACPGNTSLIFAGLKITGNLAINNPGWSRVYFVGINNSGSKWIYQLVDTGGGWDFISLPENTQAALGQIAVSPDGGTIAYLGADFTVCYYSFDGVNYDFGTMRYFQTTFVTALIDDVSGFNSLQFTDNSNLYYASGFENVFLHRCAFGEAYCENPVLSEWPVSPCAGVVDFPAVTVFGHQLRVKFTSCNAACNQWRLSYNCYTDTGVVTITVECSSLPYFVDITIYPPASIPDHYFVYSGTIRYAVYNYTLVSCCGHSQSGSFEIEIY